MSLMSLKSPAGTALPDDGKNSAWNCAKCGACAPVCPVFQADGRESMTARGRMHLLQSFQGTRPSAVFEDLFSRCLLCGACEQVCPRNLPIRDIVVIARSRFSLFYGPNGLKKSLVRAALRYPNLLAGVAEAGRYLPADSGLRLQLGLAEEPPAAKKKEAAETVEGIQKIQGISPGEADSSYFIGCFGRYLQPSVATATKGLLAHCERERAVYIPDAQYCCGLAARSAGDGGQARALARKNIQAFSDANGPIITSCASCSAHLLNYPALFPEDDPWHRRAKKFAARIEEFTAFFAKNLENFTPPEAVRDSSRIFYHDPCHLRFTRKGRSTPRALLKRAGFTLSEPEGDPCCCGQGGLFHLTCPETAERIFRQSGDRALAVRPDCITSTCSGCLMQYRQGIGRRNEDVSIKHMAVLLYERLSASRSDRKK